MHWLLYALLYCSIWETVQAHPLPTTNPLLWSSGCGTPRSFQTFPSKVGFLQFQNLRMNNILAALHGSARLCMDLHGLLTQLGVWSLGGENHGVVSRRRQDPDWKVGVLVEPQLISTHCAQIENDSHDDCLGWWSHLADCLHFASRVLQCSQSDLMTTQLSLSSHELEWGWPVFRTNVNRKKLRTLS